MKKSLTEYLEQAGISGEPEEVEKGNVSRTYKISGDTDYFLQVPGHEESLRRGLLALEMQQDTEVPVPELVHYDLEEPFLITEAVDGRNIRNTGEEKVYKKSGKILADLHDQNHSYNQYGLLSIQEDELACDGTESWRHGLDSIFNMYMRNAERILPMTEASKIDHYFMENRGTIPANTEAVIGHFDFHSDNLIHDNGEITGVLDWDMVRVVDPALEVIKTQRQFKREGKPHQAFREGYESKRKPDIDREIEEMYTLVSELSRISELQYLKESQNREPHQEEIDKTMNEINKITQEENSPKGGATVD